MFYAIERKITKHQLFIAIISSVLFSVGFSSWAFARGPDCQSFYSQNIYRFPGLKNRIHEFRMKKLEKPEINHLEVNGINYRVIGKLGGDRERVKVYLCAAPNGKRVQIKRTHDNTSWPNSIYYEMAVTRYYQEKGIIVPNIIDYKVEKTHKDNSIYITATLVKDYFEGLTGGDLFFGADSFSVAEIDHMNQRLETYRLNVAAAHKGFELWLKINGIDLYEHEFSRMDVLLKKGDLQLRNILYNADTDSGIVFDP
jgi:hypothetical protein